MVLVSEEEIAEAIRIFYTTTNNLAEGAAAAPLSTLLSAARASRQHPRSC
jgi:threonine dehydratase